MAKRKYTRGREIPVAYECTNKKCKWQGEDSEREKEPINILGTVEFTQSVCPICGNPEFYGLLEVPINEMAMEVVETFDYNGINDVYNWRTQDDRKRKYPFGLLEVGESFIYKTPHSPKKRRSFINSSKMWQAYNNAMQHKFIFEKVKEGYLCKRVL